MRPRAGAPGARSSAEALPLPQRQRLALVDRHALLLEGVVGHGLFDLGEGDCRQRDEPDEDAVAPDPRSPGRRWRASARAAGRGRAANRSGKRRPRPRPASAAPRSKRRPRAISRPEPGSGKDSWSRYAAPLSETQPCCAICGCSRPPETAAFMPNNLLRQPNFAALVALVWLLVALALLLQYWTQTAETLFDTDDAMRLAQLRAWLGGQGWFDLHQARMQPPEGYDTHWSRLIDAGLAGLLFLFGLFTDGASAERLMRAWWPLLWLLPTIAGMAAIAWRDRRPRGRDGGAAARAGRRAGLSAVHAGPHRSSQRPDRADDAHRGRDRVVGPRCDGARRRRACSRARRWPSASKRCPISPPAAPCSRSAMCSTARTAADLVSLWLVADGEFDRRLLRHHRSAALAAPFLRQHRRQHARRGRRAAAWFWRWPAG